MLDSFPSVASFEHKGLVPGYHFFTYPAFEYRSELGFQWIPIITPEVWGQGISGIFLKEGKSGTASVGGAL